MYKGRCPSLVPYLENNGGRSNFLTHGGLFSNLDNRIKGNQIILDWRASKASPRIADMLGTSPSLSARKAVYLISDRRLGDCKHTGRSNFPIKGKR